jgi:hypothetical protein
VRHTSTGCSTGHRLAELQHLLHLPQLTK